jgi:bacteriocin biosynthesis cyclodehydratase domain-containing protein
MILHVNPRYPLVWRSPSSLQFGVDSPPVTIEDVTPAQEQLIAALVGGVTRPGLDLIAETAHAGKSELSELLSLLQPVLGTAPPRASGAVAVIGTTVTASRIRSAATSLGLTVVPPDASAELGVLVSHYVVEPELFGYWLSRDIPHLPIVFSDTGVHLGPIVEPGSGPCLYCLVRHRTDSDPAWPAIASQLWGRTSPVESALVTAEVASLAMRLTLARLAGEPAAVATSLFLDAATGEVSRREWAQHPECGCAALPENDSAPVQPNAPVPAATRTGAAVSVHA